MNKVFLILTSRDVIVHQEASFPYAINAKKHKWMEEVRVILWGPTEKIAAKDKNFQEHVISLINTGVEVIACKACSDNFGASEKLEKLGVEVKSVGTLVTEMLKEGWHQLTF